MKFPELKYNRPDLETLTPEISEQITVLTEQHDLAQQVAAVLQVNSLRKKYLSQQTLAHIRFSINSNDSFYKAERDFFDQHDPTISNLVTEFYRAVVSSKYISDLEKRFGSNFVETCKRSARTSSTAVVPLLETENQLVSKYQQLLAALVIKFRGAEYNLSRIGKFNESPDRETRIAAQQALAQALSEKQAVLDELYDQLVEVRVKIAKDLGYNSFIDLTYDRMNRGGYNHKDVANFRDNILKEVLPKTAIIIERQRKRLGLEKLYFYDLGLSFVEGNPEPEGNIDELVNKATSMYSELAPETNEFWQFMLQHELMDLPSRPGKFPGGYATLIYDQKLPFIFANFNGTSHDIDVLTHEVGHTFQAYCSVDFELIEDVWPTLEACEIHSEAMEFLTWPWMSLFFGQNAERFKYNAVTKMLRFLPYAACVDHFQQEVYTQTGLTAVERRLLWRQLEKKYLPHKDYAGIEFYENGGIWQIQRHLYVNPFYYIDYALAWICATQLWLESEKDYASAWQRYLKLCLLGGSKNFFELVSETGIQSPFALETFQNVLAGVSDWIDKQEEKIK